MEGQNMPENLTQPQRKLGRRRPKNAPALRLSRSIVAALPTTPASADHFSQVQDWGLYENDQYGDCGPVSVANYVKMVTKYLTGTEISVSQDDVFDLYRRSGNPNFDPATDADDNGVDMQTMLEALQKGGIGGAHKPIAFAKVNAADAEEVRAAIAIFGGVLYGVNLQIAQQSQTDQGGPWTYSPSGQWGGHAVMAGKYDAGGTYVITWGQVIDAQNSFLLRQLEEAWVVIMPEHLGTQEFMEGIDVHALASDYEALTGRSFPIPAPDPQPTPDPDPTPTPQPVPTPPSPDPGVDPADLPLVEALLHDDWVYRRHTGDNHRVAHTAREWLLNKGYTTN